MCILKYSKLLLNKVKISLKFSQIVLPSKAIKNERILETLMFQANSGMYRIQESYLEACQQRLQKQDSRFSEWESFDYGL
jgi:RAP1 GTPase activating protein 1